MAFIFKTKNSQNWIAGFRDKNGKRRNKSTKIKAVGASNNASRKLAQKIADSFEGAARANESARHVRRVMAELHEEITGTALPNMTVAKCVESWLATKHGEVADSTYEFYSKSIANFTDFLGKERVEGDLMEIREDELEAYKAHLKGRKIAMKTVLHNWKALRMFFRYAVKKNYVAENPMDGIEISEIEKKKASTGRVKRRPFTKDELCEIFKHCEDEWKTITLFGLYSGQRLGDIARLRWENVDLEAGTLILTTGKTGLEMALPLAPDLWDHLKSLPLPIDKSLPIHPKAFASVSAKGRVSSLSNQFTKILAKAGLREKPAYKASKDGRDGKRELTGLSFHSLRHTAASLLHEAEVAPAVAMAFIGHNSEAVHSAYVTIGDEAKRAAASKLPSIL